MSVPEQLEAAGAKLWADVHAAVAAGWELDERDLHLLGRACSMADRVAALEASLKEDGPIVRGSRAQPVAHPALAELRQLELAQARLLRLLELDPPAAKTPGSARSTKAAATRWRRVHEQQGTAA